MKERFEAPNGGFLSEQHHKTCKLIQIQQKQKKERNANQLNTNNRKFNLNWIKLKLKMRCWKRFKRYNNNYKKSKNE